MILVLEMFISKGWLQYILNIMLAFFCGKVNSVGSQEYMSTSSFCTTESTGGTEGGTCDNPDEIAMGGVRCENLKKDMGKIFICFILMKYLAMKIIRLEFFDMILQALLMK